MEFKLLTIIPTRNRADLTKNAIRSVLSQEDCEFELIVSDNSNDENEADKLRAFCEETADERLTYIRPPQPLPMTQHWDWVMRIALDRSDFTHVTYLTDRMVFKKDAFKKLKEISDSFPDKLVTYGLDEIFDDRTPPLLVQNGSTRKLFEIKNEDLIKAFLQLLWVYPFPTMLNSYAPRKIIENILREYGEVFSSISPDFNFGFKVMDLEDSILYYDQALIVSYGYKHSNGRALLTGTRSTHKTAIDFSKNMNSEDIYIKGLLPFGSVVIDALLNEYFYILKNSKRRQFPALSTSKYRSRVISNVLLLQNPDLRSELIEILRKKFGIRYYEFYLRSKLPLKRYTLRLIEEALISVFPKEGLKVTKEFDNVEEALDYAIRNSPDEVRTLLNFYKRTSILPSKVRKLDYNKKH